MAFLSITYTFANSTVADATQVNTNFQDVVDALSNGTKDISISALTVAGTSTLNGNVAVGNASGDDLTVSASLASSIPIKTTRTYDIGSADLGLKILYLGGNSTHTVALQAPSSGFSGDTVFSLPPTNGTLDHFLVTDGSGVTRWTGVTGLGDAQATSLGYKKYQLGIAYNGGVTIALTSTKTITGYDGYVVPKQSQDGEWSLEFNMYYVFSDSAAAYASFNLTSVTAKNLANTGQAFAVSIDGGATGRGAQGSIEPNTTLFETWTTTTSQKFYCSGRIILNAKPSWAY